MREVVLFLTNAPTVTPGRGQTDNYSTLLTTRGQLISTSDRRALSFGSLNDETSMILRCRFQVAIANNLRSDTKIVINGITYTMNGRPELVDQRKHIYEFKLNGETK